MPKPEILSIRKPTAASPAPVAPAKPKKREDKPQFVYQSLGCFRGHLLIDNDKLRFKCLDGALIPICGIDSKLSLWLMAHPAEMFGCQDANWLVYPRCMGDSKKLQLHLKSYCGQDDTHLPVGTAVVKGKVLKCHDGRSLIGIRRNIPGPAYKLLMQRRLLQPGGELDQFVVPVYGELELGSLVELNCKLIEGRLVTDNQNT